MYQWHSQAPKSGWAQGVGGQKSPVESRGDAPISQIYTNNMQLTNAFLCRFVAESLLHLLYPQKTSDLCKSNDRTQPGQGGPTCGYATAMY